MLVMEPMRRRANEFAATRARSPPSRTPGSVSGLLRPDRARPQVSPGGKPGATTARSPPSRTPTQPSRPHQEPRRGEACLARSLAAARKPAFSAIWLVQPIKRCCRLSPVPCSLCPAVKAFAELYAALDETTKTGEKVDALARYFASVPPEDAAWAVHFLIGRRPKRLVGTRKLAGWAMEAT